MDLLGPTFKILGMYFSLRNNITKNGLLSINT